MPPLEAPKRDGLPNVDFLDFGVGGDKRLVAGVARSARRPSGFLSYTSLEVCGTMNVGNRSGHGAVETVNARNISIPYVAMTGNP